MASHDMQLKYTARENIQMTKERVSWETYFMNIAKEVSTRSTCDRKHVGAVIVRDRTLLSTGYNGSIKGLPHCNDAGCEMVDEHCIRTSHAEANAIVQAAKNGVKIDDSEIYVTASPCYNCFKLIANSGIKVIFYNELYRDEQIKDRAKEVGIELISLGN
jgi:dCMP deaminase